MISVSIENIYDINEDADNNDILPIKPLSEEDKQKMRQICEAAHDQENEKLKAKFSELSVIAEKKYELYRYYRYSAHIEIILYAEDDYGDDSLITVMFIQNDWYHLDGHCSRETFYDILEAVSDLWDSIKDTVQVNQTACDCMEIEE